MVSWYESIQLLSDGPKRKNHVENYCKNSLWIKQPDQFSSAVSWDGIFSYSDSLMNYKKKIKGYYAIKA